MAYIKNNWVDREGTTRYFKTVDDDGALILTPDYTQVTEMGTPVNADNMNHIEEGIAAGSFTKYDSKVSYALNDLITVIEEDSPAIYKSLQDNNTGNALSNSAFWEKISLGGGGGLEIGDIGIAPLGIDETQGKRRYLNGQVIIQEQYVQFTNKVKSAVELYPSLACTEDEWQTTSTMTVGGQVGKFVIDNEAGTIRLPKIIMPIQGLTDLGNLAEIVEAGLPDHRHYTVTSTAGWNKIPVDTTHAISTADNIDNGWAAYNLCNGVGEADVARTSTASTFNAIHGNSSTVQPEAIQYPYFIQVATGSEESVDITREIELNNPFVLLEGKYFETPVYNISWLQSNAGFTGSSAVHTSAYEALLVEYNSEIEVGTTTSSGYTKRGLNVKLHTEAYTDYDFVLNTGNSTFRCPTKLKTMNRYLVEAKQATSDDPTWYNLYSDGWIEQGGVANNSGGGQNGTTFNFPIPFANTDYTLTGSVIPTLSDAAGQWLRLYTVSTSQFRASMGWTSGASHNYMTGNFRWRACGYIAETATESLTDKLYFYVGETVQNANLVNIGRVEEKVASLIPDNSSLISNYAMPSNRYIDLTLGASGTRYTAPADGYYVLNMTSGGAHFMCITNMVTLFQGYMLTPSGSWQNGVWAPVKKGDVVEVAYNYPTLNWFRFVYAVGSESEA